VLRTPCVLSVIEWKCTRN